MFGWLNDNSGALNVIVNVAMLLVWILYFQLLYVSFRRQKRPNILINRSAGSDANARCLISNMSASPVYVQAVMVEMEKDGTRFEATISDTEQLGDEETASKAMERTKQGPLNEGDFMDIGRFRDIVTTAAQNSRPHEDFPKGIGEIDEIRITVAAVYTASDKMIGATRAFRVTPSKHGIPHLHPQTLLAKQLGRWGARRALARKIRESG